jgi:hypothetical protein
MPVKYEVTAKLGTYTDHQGNEKSRWQKCGIVFENDRGNLSLKLEAVPVGSEWEGWFSLFEPKPREQKRQPQAQQNPNDFEDSDLPF